MDYDFSELVKGIKEACRIIIEAFKKLWDKIKPYITKFWERVQEIEYEKRIKFKPVLEIKPTKTYYQNKNITNYYCRNNC